MAKNSGWVPQQHGAWAMLAVPSLVGTVQAVTSEQAPHWVGRVALLLAFWVGYFCFNAVTLLIKAPPRRRRLFVRPVAIYAAASALCLLLAVGLLGWGLLTWGLAYGPLAAAALLLVWMRQERSTVSGALTVAAASLFAAVLVAPQLSELVARWREDPHTRALWTALVCFLYFFGTVWAVKTMIRRRGSRWWWLASIGFHAVATAVATAGTLTGHLTWPYLVFFLATTARAAALPLIGPMATPPRTITPKQLGIGESVFSVVLTVLLLALPPH